jgi:hypothetical protein
VFGILALYAATGAFFASRAPHMDLAGRPQPQVEPSAD